METIAFALYVYWESFKMCFAVEEIEMLCFDTCTCMITREYTFQFRMVVEWFCFSTVKVTLATNQEFEGVPFHFHIISDNVPP